MKKKNDLLSSKSYRKFYLLFYWQPPRKAECLPCQTAAEESHCRGAQDQGDHQGEPSHHCRLQTSLQASHQPLTVQDNAVFGCALEHQTMHSTNTCQVPQFLWKCIQKIESKPHYLPTEGIYRVPGDAAKIQKIRIDIDQVTLLPQSLCRTVKFQGKWDFFEKCDAENDIHVLAGSLKLFLRELPHPLLPYSHHANLRQVASGHGRYRDDIPASMTVNILDTWTSYQWSCSKFQFPSFILYLH